jgi:hypothetical protein
MSSICLPHRVVGLSSLRSAWHKDMEVGFTGNEFGMHTNTSQAHLRSRVSVSIMSSSCEGSRFSNESGPAGQGILRPLVPPVRGPLHMNKVPMYGCQIKTEFPILHVKQDKLHPIGFGDGAGASSAVRLGRGSRRSRVQGEGWLKAAATKQQANRWHSKPH